MYIEISFGTIGMVFLTLVRNVWPSFCVCQGSLLLYPSTPLQAVRRLSLKKNDAYLLLLVPKIEFFISLEKVYYDTVICLSLLSIHYEDSDNRNSNRKPIDTILPSLGDMRFIGSF